MDILKEVKSLLGISPDAVKLNQYFYVEENQYCVWTWSEGMNLYRVEAFGTEDTVFELDVSTTIQPLTDEEYLFLSISECQVYVSHNKFLETLRSLINDKG
jgi:hypothetical protein